MAQKERTPKTTSCYHLSPLGFSDDKRLQMLTALCLIGSTFMLRSLSSLQLHSIEAVVNKLSSVHEPQSDLDEIDEIVGLFQPIAETHPISCRHNPSHTTLEDIQRCLLSHFRDCLDDIEWLFETPKFSTFLNRPSSVLRLSNRHILPFLEQIEIRHAASKEHSFSHFKIEPSFWELEEGPFKQNDALFRKEIRMPNSTANAENPLWKGMIKIVEAVACLHKPPLPVNDKSDDTFIGAHFDIKPANILVDSQANTLILTDFGQARLKRLNNNSVGSGITAAEGTWDYRPPKLTNEKKLYRAYNIWSLACVLTEVLVFIFSKTRQDVAEFRDERRKASEQDNVVSHTFWTREQNQGNKAVLKHCVQV
ncbi:hypothetical protein Hte_001780 [Hypoxylon texense]